MRGISETVKHLIIINGIFFFASGLLGGTFSDLMALHFYKNVSFQPWQPLTHMFMHGGIYHLFFNMLGLWMFGSPLEQMWGRQKVLFYYFSTGIGAAALQWRRMPTVFIRGRRIASCWFSSAEILDTLVTGKYNTAWLEVLSQSDIGSLYSSYMSSAGASGALYGILVAFAFSFPETPLMLLFVPFPIKAKYFVHVLIVGDLFFGFSSISVGPNPFAHVGGQSPVF